MFNIQAWVFRCYILSTFLINAAFLKSDYAQWRLWLCYFQIK